MSLRKKAIHGAGWITGARLLRNLSSLLTLSILSRFLPPEAFGLAGMVFFFIGLAQTFGDFGTRVALVRKAEISEIEIDSVFWCNLAIGMVLTLGVALGAPMIERASNTPGLAGPLAWAAPVFALTALQGVPSSLLERRLKFNVIALTDVGSALIGAATAIVMVMMGYGVEALIAQTVVMSVVGVLMLNLAARWWPRLRFSRAALKPLLQFGLWAAMSGLVAYIGSSAERPVLGIALSAAALGYFTLAQQIVFTPVRTIVDVARRMTLPLFSRIQDEKARSQRAYLDTTHALMVLMAPICLGMVAVAEPFITAFLGHGWDPVAPILMIQAVFALLTTINNINAGVMTAHGEVKFQFVWTLFSATAAMAVLLWAAQWGLLAACFARLALSSVVSPIYAGFTLRRLGLGWGSLAANLWRPLLAGVLMCAAVRGLMLWAGQFGLAGLIAGIVAGGLLYPALLLLVDRARTLQLVRSVLKRGG